MSSSDFVERRHDPRGRQGRIATMKLGAGLTPRYVLITDASSGGVRLQLNSVEAVDEFVLLFHGGCGPARDGTYKIVWRHGREIGAKFVSAVTENA